jgi:hypothetical protein
VNTKAIKLPSSDIESAALLGQVTETQDRSATQSADSGQSAAN